MSDKQEALDFQLKCKENPLFHIKNVQGVKTLEPYQCNIIEAIKNNDRVCIRSPHDVGKTFLMSKIVLWFGSSFHGSKIITTAPTHNQVKRLLWSEIRSGWRRSKTRLGGEMLMTEWKIEEDWFAIGFTSRGQAETGQEGQGTASGFQGFHAKHILIIFDEATGIPRHIWAQVEGMLTSASVKFVAIGNPTSRATDFFKCFQDPAWHKMKISCFDSPNFLANNILHIGDLEEEVRHVKTLSDEDKEARINSYSIAQGQLMTLKWAVSMALKWGMTHPLFISKVIGDFPDEDDNVMIQLGTVEASQRRYEEITESKTNKNWPEIFKLPTSRIIGVDPARYGPDDTVIVCLEDNVQVLRKKMPKMVKSTEDDPAIQTVNFIINHLKSVPRIRREEICVDATGLGSAIISGLILARQVPENARVLRNVVIREIHYGVQCDNEDDRGTYANLKAKIFQQLADSLKEDLAIMPESVYLEQLPTILYRFTPKGQLAIESKDEYKARTGMGSPDDSDALALANHGRVDLGSFGEYTKEMVEDQKRSKPIASGIRSGDQW